MIIVKVCGPVFRRRVKYEDYHAQLNIFRLEEIPEIDPTYNLAPIQFAPIIQPISNPVVVKIAIIDRL